MQIFIGTFLIALSTLGYEIALTRLLSVVTWYYLSFFAVSAAMLGMTAGAVTVYVKDRWFADGRIGSVLANACLAYALAIPFTLAALCAIPLGSGLVPANLLALLALTLASMLPFYFSGIAITAALTKSGLPTGRIYASDLAGAAAGCLLVLAGIEVMDAPSLILLCGAFGVASALVFSGKDPAFRYRAAAFTAMGALAVVAILNSFVLGIRPVFVKGRPENPDQFLYEKWNSFSRVTVSNPMIMEPNLWVPSLATPGGELSLQAQIKIDGDTGTAFRKFSSPADIEHLRYDMPNLAYYLRPAGGACIIGVGGGKDVQSAILFGHERVTGIEVNGILIGLHRGLFRSFTGIADYPGVTLAADEARSYIARHPDRYSVIQMSLIDTWAATGAGAFALSKNSLYTLEAWKTFYRHLADDGIFTVTRWHNPRNLGETGRVVSLAAATLLESGRIEPVDHIAMFTASNASTLLLSREPFSARDIEVMREIGAMLRFDLTIAPGTAPANPVLGRILASRSRAELEAAVAGDLFDYRPSTDNNPYFFNMLKLDRLGETFAALRRQAWGGIIYGNLVANVTLIGLLASLCLLTAATIVVPLLWRTRGRPGSPVLWPAAAYFSLIGAGFMLVELAFMQRLSVFLGHPVYALGVILFTVIASSGAGSYLSDRLPLDRRPWVFVYPAVIAAAVLGMRFAFPATAAALEAARMPLKIAAAMLLIAPVGVLMGMCFPAGMRLVRKTQGADTPWYWALNGVFGVLASALSVFISIYCGISATVYLAAACYLLLLPCLPHMLRASEGAEAPTDAIVPAAAS